MTKMHRHTMYCEDGSSSGEGGGDSTSSGTKTPAKRSADVKTPSDDELRTESTKRSHHL